MSRACGICGTDAHFVAGEFPGMSWPLTPGHEIAGKIAEIGDGRRRFRGRRSRRRRLVRRELLPLRSVPQGHFIHCVNGKVPSWQYPGGYAESVTVPANAHGPDSRPSCPTQKPPRWAAPASRPITRCATPRRCPVTGWRFSASVGSAISGCSSPERWVSRPSRSIAAPPKTEDALKLGAHHYIDSTAGDVSRSAEGPGRGGGRAGHRGQLEGHGRNRRRTGAPG